MRQTSVPEFVVMRPTTVNTRDLFTDFSPVVVISNTPTVFKLHGQANNEFDACGFGPYPELADDECLPTICDNGSAIGSRHPNPSVTITAIGPPNAAYALCCRLYGATGCLMQTASELKNLVIVGATTSPELFLSAVPNGVSASPEHPTRILLSYHDDHAPLCT